MEMSDSTRKELLASCTEKELQNALHMCDKPTTASIHIITTCVSNSGDFLIVERNDCVGGNHVHLTYSEVKKLINTCQAFVTWKDNNAKT